MRRAAASIMANRRRASAGSAENRDEVFTVLRAATRLCGLGSPRRNQANVVRLPRGAQGKAILKVLRVGTTGGGVGVAEEGTITNGLKTLTPALSHREREEVKPTLAASATWGEAANKQQRRRELAAWMAARCTDS